MKNSLLANFIKYVSLNILGQMIYSCYTMTDTFFVSLKLGTDGLTALNLAFPVFCIMNGIGLMTGIGAGNKYSIYKSRNTSFKANRIFTNAVWLSITFSVLFLSAGFFCSEKLTTLLGADAQVFEPTHTYLHIMLLFSPAFLFNNLIQCFIRNDGRPELSARAMIIGSVSNIILDYIFIFPFDMGISGAIIATGMAPLISMAVVIPYFVKKQHGFHLIKARPRKRSITAIISGGIPTFLTEAASGIVMLLFNFIILQLAGNTGVAAFGVITVISLVVTAIYTGLSQGVQPLLSQNFGQGQTKATDQLLHYSIYAVIILSVLIYSIIFFNTDFLIAIFNSENNASLHLLARNGLRLYFIACPFIGLNIVLSTYLICTEHALPAQLISVMRSFAVLIPVAFILSYLMNMTGVWCAYPVSELITACCGVLLFFKTHKKSPPSLEGQ